VELLTGTAKDFLSYNEDNVMMQLLALEAHLRLLTPNYKSEHASCCIKHILTLREQAQEGVSHASELGMASKAQIFRELDSGAQALRGDLEKGVHPDELIRKVRELRRKAEALNPSFNLESCKTCGNIDEILAKLKIPKTNIAELEEEAAHRIIDRLSSKYNVPKPKLKLLDSCPTEPTEFGLFQLAEGEPQIVLCRGSADAHKLSHEFMHYLQFLQKKPLNEQEAEQFALKEVAKPLYAEASHFNNGGKRMASWREIGVIYGGQHIGKGISRGLKELDRYMGKEAAAVQERPSTWVVVAGAVGLPLLAVYAKLKDPWDKLAILTGGFLSTNLWDIVEEAMVAAGGAAGAAYVPARYVPPGPVSATVSASAPAQTAAQEKVY
jgi:hypothetical protein